MNFSNALLMSPERMCCDTPCDFTTTTV